MPCRTVGGVCSFIIKNRKERKVVNRKERKKLSKRNSIHRHPCKLIATFAQYLAGFSVKKTQSSSLLGKLKK